MRLKSGKEIGMSKVQHTPVGRYNTCSDLASTDRTRLSPMAGLDRDVQDKSDTKLSRSNSADNLFRRYENDTEQGQAGLNTSQLGQKLLRNVNRESNSNISGSGNIPPNGGGSGDSYPQRQHAPGYSQLQHQIAGMQNSTRLAFIASDEIRKFKGNKRLGEHLFSPGPSFEEFLSTFLVFCNRHGLYTDEDRITALRLNVDQNQGDASVILASALDSNLNKTQISFVDLTNYLGEIYRPIANLNLNRAAAGFISKLNTKLEDGTGNPIEQLRKLELSAKELVKTFLSRPHFQHNSKSTEDTCLELLILTAYSSFVGEKLSNKVLENLPPNLPPRDIFQQVHHEIRKNFTEQTGKIASFAETNANSMDLPRGREKSSRQENFPRNTVRFRERSKSSGTAHKNFRDKYYCNLCKINGHTLSHCRRRQQDDRTKNYCTFCQIAGHNIDVCRKRKFRTGEVSRLPLYKTNY